MASSQIVQEDETTSLDGRAVDALAEHIEALPSVDQLELLMRIAPKILGDLEEANRVEVLAHLGDAIAERASASRYSR